VLAHLTARRIAQQGWRAPVPVICCGNATVGGAGKTTVALDLAARLQGRGVAVHIISRGYGGRLKGPVRVEPVHTAGMVGDEPMLLAQVAPTWIGTDRAASARAAVAAGAEALLMDDGLQNPSLVQDAGLLVIDGATGFGNGRVMPAGPLREPAAAAAARCRAAIMIGMDQRGARRALPPGMQVLEAWLAPDQSMHGQRVVAFAGIARPAKFHATLLQAGATLAATIDFPDHHKFRLKEFQAILDRARQLDATPVTTPKDAVRLPPVWRDQVQAVGVRMVWADEAALERLLAEIVP
jgi:tetraacyldisaccharide 4'-kinase